MSLQRRFGEAVRFRNAKSRMVKRWPVTAIAARRRHADNKRLRVS